MNKKKANRLRYYLGMNKILERDILKRYNKIKLEELEDEEYGILLIRIQEISKNMKKNS